MSTEGNEYVAGKRNSKLTIGMRGTSKGKHSKPQEPGDVKKYKHEKLRAEKIIATPPPITPPRSQYGQCFQNFI